MSIWSGLLNRARIITDRRYRHVYAQRRITEMPKRQAAADRFASKLPRPLPLSNDVKIFDSLDINGYAFLPNLVSDDQVNDIRRYLDTKLTFDPYHPQAGGFKSPDNAPAGTHVAYFEHADVVNAPHLLSIANNPGILAAVGNVLGAKPTISYMTSWWSIAHGEELRLRAGTTAFRRDTISSGSRISNC